MRRDKSHFDCLWSKSERNGKFFEWDSQSGNVHDPMPGPLFAAEIDAPPETEIRDIDQILVWGSVRQDKSEIIWSGKKTVYLTIGAKE